MSGPRASRRATPTSHGARVHIGTAGHLAGFDAAGRGIDVEVGSGLTLVDGVLEAAAAGGGDVVGDTASTPGNVVTMSGIDGKHVEDSGVALTALLTSAGAAAAYQPLSAGLTAWATLLASTPPNNGCWTVGLSPSGAVSWVPRDIVGYSGWRAQVGFGASNTWAIIGPDSSGATGYTQSTPGAAASTGIVNSLRTTTLTTAASSGSVASFVSSSSLGSRAGLSVVVLTGEMPADLTSARVWLGYATTGTAANMGAADAPTGIHYVGLLRSTSAAGTNLYIVESDGSSQLSTDTGVVTAAIPADTAYSVAFSWDYATKTSVQVWLSIAGGAYTLIGTASTYVPGAGSGMVIGASTTALSASARVCRQHAAAALRD